MSSGTQLEADENSLVPGHAHGLELLPPVVEKLLVLLACQLLQKRAAFGLVTVFVFLATAAGTGIISPDLGYVARGRCVREARPHHFRMVLDSSPGHNELLIVLGSESQIHRARTG